MTDSIASVASAPAQPTVSRRTLANRRNAARSTGPRTAEGKARSRANAVKHGLAGAGICLPSEDAALVQERCLQLHEEMAPATVRGMMLVEMMALAHTRAKRAARQEIAVLTDRQRVAPIAWADARLTEAEEDFRLLGVETRTRYRHLRMCPEGIDLLTDRLHQIRAEVRREDLRWSYIHGICLESACGREYGDKFSHSRGRALSRALEFEADELTDTDKAQIAQDWHGQIKEWARPQMEALIDEELARLAAHRATLDHAAIARSQTEAADRALFDAGRDAALARRYEAAAFRLFFRAQQEYRLVEAEGFHHEPDPDQPTVLDHPCAAVAEALDEGDRITIVDPADRAAAPPPERRVFERQPLASSGITTQQASDVISQPDAAHPPVPFHRPAPAIDCAPARGWHR